MPSRGADWPYLEPKRLSRNASCDHDLSEAMVYDAGESCRPRASDHCPCLNDSYAGSWVNGPDSRLSWNSRNQGI